MIFSCSLNSVIVAFTFQGAIICCSLYCLTSGEKYLPSVLLVTLRLSWSFCGCTCSVCLSCSCGRILRLVCHLSILWSLVVCWRTSLLLPRGPSLPGLLSQASFLRDSATAERKGRLGCPWECVLGVGHPAEAGVDEISEALVVPLGLHGRGVSHGPWAGWLMESLMQFVGALSS